LENGKVQSQDHTWTSSRIDSSRDSASKLFRSSSSPNQERSIGAGAEEAGHYDTFVINRPVLSRNLNQNLTHQSDIMEAHNPSALGRVNREEHFYPFDAAESFRSNSQENESPLPLYAQSNNARDRYDEVEELRDFLSVSRTYDECVQFFQNLDSSSAVISDQKESSVCFQSELKEAKSQLFNLSMELELEKSNSKKIYENFHIAVWVYAFCA
jgi:hypothetical protein